MADHSEWKRLGTGDLLTEDADVGLGHMVPVKQYTQVFMLLVVLTIVTVWAATWPVSEGAHLLIALFIAFIKAAAVFAIFMHLKFEGKLIWFVATYPLIIFGLMVLGTTGDKMMKEPSVPTVVDINYKMGQAMGVQDQFLKPNPEREKLFEAH